MGHNFNFEHLSINLSLEALVEIVIAKKEGVLGRGGSILVYTGKHTGRSPNDKYLVYQEELKEKIWWDNNNKISEKHFEILCSDINDYASSKQFFGQDLFACADKNFQLKVRVFTEYAWHSAFIKHLLISPTAEELNSFEAEFTIINCPNFRASPEKHGCNSETLIVINFQKKMAIICGTEYAGEIKKIVFTILNYLLPERDVMPMHCSATQEKDDPSNVTIFFGLSGTGKTTLSSDENKILVGDDEHGWSNNGVFNFEGGCYAKTINLSEEDEPQIFGTLTKFGTIIENMTFKDSDRFPNLDDSSITQNTRCAYPLSYIDNISPNSCADLPKNIIMLTCDAFGVLPPISELSLAESIFYFLSGFTSKVAGTEGGVVSPSPTFSSCFGAPFLPLHPHVYGKLLKARLLDSGCKCWLVNTGWIGGGYAVGKRIDILTTRKIILAITSNLLKNISKEIDPSFGLKVPFEVPGVEKRLLSPRSLWEKEDLYDNEAKKVRQMFIENFKQFKSFVDKDVNNVVEKLKSF